MVLGGEGVCIYRPALRREGIKTFKVVALCAKRNQFQVFA
jgi:hypothetical protein